MQIYTQIAFKLAKIQLQCLQTVHEKLFRNSKFRETSDLGHIYKNELDKACFAHDAAYTDSKDLATRTISNKIWKDRAYEIATNPKYDRYRRGLASMVYKFFDKKIGSGTTNKRDLT